MSNGNQVPTTKALPSPRQARELGRLTKDQLATVDRRVDFTQATSLQVRQVARSLTQRDEDVTYERDEDSQDDERRIVCPRCGHHF